MPVRVVVIGAGFTGTAVVAHLARLGTPVATTLVEQTGRFAAGLAYQTSCLRHVLNVPAARMSAFADDPSHFLRWAAAHHADVRPEAFLPRPWYAAYLGQVLAEAPARAVPGSTVTRVEAEAIAVRKVDDGWLIRCRDGSTLVADLVVLAIGNFPPANPPTETTEFYDTTWYRQDPWAPGALAVDAEDDVLVLGTGLTMVDVAVRLDDEGHRGRIVAVSRRAQIPAWLREDTRVPHDVAPPASLGSWPRTTRGLVRAFRREVADRELAGGEWRDVVAGLRRATPALWASLSLVERRRFLRHVRPYWDTHRHGAAPAVGQTIDRLRAAGRLSVMAGRVLRYDATDEAVTATVRRRGAAYTETLSVRRVINCTGPDTDLRRVGSALVEDLDAQGLVTADPLGLGLVTDAAGRLVDRHGRSHPGLYLVGPLTRGRTWEGIAVPELREQADALVRHLANVIAASVELSAARP